MKENRVFCSWLLLWLLPILLLGGGSSVAKAETGLLMPMYGNTTTQFTEIYEAALKVPVIAILNPDDGVGWAKDSFIAGKVNLLKSRGVRIIGYIASEYGSRDPEEVDAEADRYKSWYGVSGLFIDEVSTSTSSAKISYYKSIRAYAKLIGIGYIVLNPGTTISSTYLQAGDIIVDYEHANWQINFASAGRSSWVASNPWRAAAIVYGASGADMPSLIDSAIAKAYEWVYVTDRNEPDPFGVSASYFAAEIDYLYAKNHPPPPALPAHEFKITSSTMGSPAPGSPADRMICTVTTAPGRTYELQCSATLAAGSWQPATAISPAGLPCRGVSSGPTLTWQAALTPDAPQCFFRVVDITP